MKDMLQIDALPEGTYTDDAELEYDSGFDPYGGLTILDLAEKLDEAQREHLCWEDALPPVPEDDRALVQPDPEQDKVYWFSEGHPNSPEFTEFWAEMSQLRDDVDPITSGGWAGLFTLDQQVSGKVEDLNWDERRITFTKRVPLGYQHDPHPVCDGYGTVADWESTAAGFSPEEIQDLPDQGAFYSMARTWKQQYQRFLNTVQTLEQLRTLDSKTCSQRLDFLWKAFWKKQAAIQEQAESLLLYQVLRYEHREENGRRYIWDLEHMVSEMANKKSSLYYRVQQARKQALSSWLSNYQRAVIVLLFTRMGKSSPNSLEVARETILRWKNYKEARYSHLQDQRNQLLEEMELLGDLE